MSSEKLYGHYEAGLDCDNYADHVMAMTGEKLHSKSEIAAELAYRDTEIATLQARIAELEEAQRWIPVGERLPDVDARAMFGHWADYPGSDKEWLWVASGELHEDGQYWFDFVDQYMEVRNWHTVTHWMPLPTPPEVGDV